MSRRALCSSALAPIQKETKRVDTSPKHQDHKDVAGLQEQPAPAEPGPSGTELRGSLKKKRRIKDYVPLMESSLDRVEKELSRVVITAPGIINADAKIPVEKDEPVYTKRLKGVQVSDQKPGTMPEAESLTAMLQEAGLADTSEEQLGSLDRTQVSLGDSEQTTESKIFIRDQWGTEGTMMKILHLVKEREESVTVERLLAKGPVITEYKRIIAVRCFTSILKLQQHQFIRIQKHPDSSEILDIKLGLKFY